MVDFSEESCKFSNWTLTPAWRGVSISGVEVKTTDAAVVGSSDLLVKGADDISECGRAIVGVIVNICTIDEYSDLSHDSAKESKNKIADKYACFTNTSLPVNHRRCSNRRTEDSYFYLRRESPDHLERKHDNVPNYLEC